MKYDFLELNSQQNQALYERGFVVAPGLRWGAFGLYLLSRVCLFTLIVFVFFYDSRANYGIWLAFIFFAIWKLIVFLPIHTIFHTPYGFLLRGKLVDYNDILKYTNSFHFGFSITNKKISDIEFGIFGGIIFIGFITLFTAQKGNLIPYIFGFALLIFLLLCEGKGFILHNPFQPTYQGFVQLGLHVEKSLQIVEKSSDAILNNFSEDSKDINFSQFQKHFNHLAKKFTIIILQLQKMEIMEKHMQQGDIIDTSKYIIYLKKEINRPMQKLHRFLENQRNTLMNQDAVLSLEQFSDNPLTQNIELQKRRIVIAQKSLDISIKQLGEFLKKISG